jgi:predicted nucleotidyltransferase
MGRVFTWDEIHKKEVPQRENFVTVERELRDAFKGEPSVKTASFFGSYVRDDFNVRSDVDCLVVYDPGEESVNAIELLQRLSAVGKSLLVPINFTPCDVALARTRMHNFGPSFLKHLETSAGAGGRIKGSLEGLFVPTISIKDEIGSYLRAKLYNLAEAEAQMGTFSEERLAAFLKKVLEAPLHVARKMLVYEKKMTKGDSKREVRNLYDAMMPKYMARMLEELLELDTRYSGIVDLQLKRPDQVAYEQAIDMLKRDVRSVINFVRYNAMRFDQPR